MPIPVLLIVLIVGFLGLWFGIKNFLDNINLIRKSLIYIFLLPFPLVSISLGTLALFIFVKEIINR